MTEARTLPDDVRDLLAKPNPAVITTLGKDGRPVSVATWYVLDPSTGPGGRADRILVNMDEGRKRLEHIRNDPRVSITVLGSEDWYHHVTLRGRIVEINENALDDIDRISTHYTGQRYGDRERGRVSAWIEVDSWYSWAINRPWAA